MRSSSLNSKRFVLVDYLQEQVVKLQDTVERLRDSKEAETEWGSGFQSQWWGTIAC